MILQFANCLPSSYNVRFDKSIYQSIFMQDEEANYAAAVSALEKLIAKAKIGTSTSLKSCIVALYTADDDNPLRFSEKIGMLQLDIDRIAKCHMLRFYDIETLKLLLEVQIYYGFGENYYRVQKDTLYVFDYFADGMIGFEFRDKAEADVMHAKIKSVAPKNEQFRELQKSKIQKEIEEKKSKTFFGKIKKKINNLISEEEAVKESSVVTFVEKQKSIAMNFETGEFNMENIPVEWQEIFDTIGLSKEDLKSKEIVDLIFQETIIYETKKAAEKNPEERIKLMLEGIEKEEKLQDAKQFEAINANGQESKVSTLPPPPPITNLIQQISTSSPCENTNVSSSNRVDFLAQIKSNKIKLKPVKTTDHGIELDASSMNKEERKDLGEHLRLKLQRRKLALNRRKASSSDDEND